MCVISIFPLMKSVIFSLLYHLPPNFSLSSFLTKIVSQLIQSMHSPLQELLRHALPIKHLSSKHPSRKHFPGVNLFSVNTPVTPLVLLHRCTILWCILLWRTLLVYTLLQLIYLWCNSFTIALLTLCAVNRLIIRVVLC